MTSEFEKERTNDIATRSKDPKAVKRFFAVRFLKVQVFKTLRRVDRLVPRYYCRPNWGLLPPNDPKFGVLLRQSPGISLVTSTIPG